MTDRGQLCGLDVVVLAGGLGTRLRPVLGEQTPKVLAPVRGRPFLDHLADRLAAAGAGQMFLSLGFLADRVVAHLSARQQPLPVHVVVEHVPLGTAGALRLVAPQTASDPIILMNGDTWLSVDLGQALQAHERSGRLITVVCVGVPNGARYGRIDVGTDGAARLLGKFEDDERPALVSAGVVFLSRRALSLLQDYPGPSLENDFLGLLPTGSLGAFIAHEADFIDIGTPESLARADDVVNLSS